MEGEEEIRGEESKKLSEHDIQTRVARLAASRLAPRISRSLNFLRTLPRIFEQKIDCSHSPVKRIKEKGIKKRGNCSIKSETVRKKISLPINKREI